MQSPEQTNYYSVQPLPYTEPLLTTDNAPSPNDPPWNAWLALAFWILSIALMAFVPAVLLIPYIFSKGPITDRESLIKSLGNDPTAIFIQLLGVLPAHLITLGLAYLLVTNGRKYSFTKMLGWSSGGLQWYHYLALLVAITTVVIVVSTYFPPEETTLSKMLQSSLGASILTAIFATFTAPIVEEVVYRGLLFSAFQRSVGSIAAILIVTAMFAGVHVPQYIESPTTIGMILLLSLMLTLMRYYSKNLLPCIIFHTLFNGLQSILIVATALTGENKPVTVDGMIHHLLK